jgi:cold shock CspA family protein
MGITAPPPRRGTVAEFDEQRGWGSIRAEDGEEHFFHCTAIADGSRTIAVGTSVRYGVVAGRLGRWEASAIEPASG